LTEAALLLALPLALHPDRVWAAGASERAGGALAFLALALFSMHLHVVGAAFGDHGWNATRFRGRQDASLFWSVGDSQVAWTLGGAGTPTEEPRPPRRRRPPWRG